MFIEARLYGAVDTEEVEFSLDVLSESSYLLG